MFVLQREDLFVGFGKAPKRQGDMGFRVGRGSTTGGVARAWLDTNKGNNQAMAAGRMALEQSLSVTSGRSACMLSRQVILTDLRGPSACLGYTAIANTSLHPS
jgi:hypothetical protein